MILFRPCHVPLILRREKTETRRLWLKGCRVKEGSIHQAKTTLFGEAFAELRILKVYKQMLADMTEADAKAEGEYTMDQYRRIWAEINGFWEASTVVWVVKFEILDPALNSHNCLECGKRCRVIRVSPYRGQEKPTGLYLRDISEICDGRERTIGVLCDKCWPTLIDQGKIGGAGPGECGRILDDLSIDGSSGSYQPKHPEYMFPDKDDEDEDDEEDPLEF
jgi:hypothetical protein